MKKVIGLFLASVCMLSMTSCKSNSEDLMKNVQQVNEENDTEADGTETTNLVDMKKFTADSADFSIALFKNSVDKKENSMVSPLSVLTALSMTANGADNNTLTQMEATLGKNQTIDELNQNISTWLKVLPATDKAKIKIADSIWFCDKEDNLSVNDNFLKKNKTYYDADIYKSPFDSQTVDDINKWVSKHTDDMIKEVISELSDETVMCLINAVAFDAEWEEVYNAEQVSEETFTTADGTEETVDMMHSSEYGYIEDKQATGFIKPYADGYSFVALLPNDGVTLSDYIAGMTGEQFIEEVNNAKDDLVYATLPKFTSEYSITLNEALIQMGMKDAFDADTADFSKLGTSDMGNIYINKVIHKTYISVDELGTKAGAVTAVICDSGSAAEDYHEVVLNRPFVYAIIDNETGLPIFIGTLQSTKS